MMSIPEEIPSSPAQEALWWIQHRAERKDLYNLTWRLRVPRLDAGVLDTAWRLVVERHEVLRTAFARRGDGVVQLVHPAGDGTAVAPVQVVAWREAPTGRTPEAWLDAVAARLHAVPFDLESAPLARLALVSVGEVHDLLVTVHHSVLDGWAMHLVVDDLRTAYEAVRAGGPSPVTAARVFPDPAVPYRAFGRVAGGSARAREERAYWTGRLRGVRAAALTPVGGGSGGSGAAVRRRLSGTARAAVADIAARVGCTAFAVQLAAVRTVLARGGATGRTALGVVVANRLGQEDQRRVGYCANTVLLADEVTDADRFDDVVGRVRDSLWESLPYQHVGFSEVFAELSAEDRAALGSTPPVLVTHHGGIGSGLTLGGGPARLLPSPSTSARCQLLVGVFEEDGGTVLEIEYDTDQVREDAVHAFLDDVERVLTAPVGPVGDVRVSSRAVAGVPGPRPAAAEAPAAVEASAAGRAVDRVLANWESVLGTAVRADDDFFAVGGHSLQVLELVARVEATAGRELDVPEWLEEPTPRRMAHLLAPARGSEGYGASGARAREVTLVTLRNGVPGGPHLHLVPGAGVGSVPYRELAGALPADWRVTVGEDGGAGPTTVEELVARHLEPLLDGGPLPDLLGGWSMGGLLVHAMAAGLRRRGPGCPPLLLLDPPVPGDFTRERSAASADAFADGVLRAAGTAVPPPDRLRLGDRPDRGVPTLAALLRAAGGEAPPDALHARYLLHERHLAALRGYREAAVADVPALLVAADLTDADVARWRALFAGPVRTVRVPVDHYALLRGDSVRRVAELAAELLPVAVP
ncbi:condensation domain-containing protein [Streptomyces sp. NPDC006997]|uniref:condensation domain-containing protein n=1 Tax=Streptomyces sp. NPDC006997 TaxID=3155356 RepID=UPI0033F11E07